MKHRDTFHSGLHIACLNTDNAFRNTEVGHVQYTNPIRSLLSPHSYARPAAAAAAALNTHTHAHNTTKLIKRLCNDHFFRLVRFEWGGGQGG